MAEPAPAEPNNQPSDPPADPTPNDPPADPAPNDPPADPPKEPAASDPPKDPEPAFPDDWREKMAGGDEKLLKQLQRFTSPERVAKAFADVRAKLSSGEYKRQLPEDATDDEKAEWRKENGIPDSPEGYEVKLEDGLEIREGDEPLIESFKTMAHESNLPADAVNSTLNWYFKLVEDIGAKQSEVDKTFRAEATDELREEWGGEFRANVNAAKSMFGEFGDLLFNARLPSETPGQLGPLLGDHPGFMKWAAQTARELNPSATIMPNGANNLDGVQSEIEKIEDYMRKDRKAYNKDTKAQERLMQLYTARDKLKE